MEPFSFQGWLKDHRREIKQKQFLSIFGDNFETEVGGLISMKEIFKGTDNRCLIFRVNESRPCNPICWENHAPLKKQFSHSLPCPLEMPTFGHWSNAPRAGDSCLRYFYLQNQPEPYFHSLPLRLKQLPRPLISHIRNTSKMLSLLTSVFSFHICLYSTLGAKSNSNV